MSKRRGGTISKRKREKLADRAETREATRLATRALERGRRALADGGPTCVRCNPRALGGPAMGRLPSTFGGRRYQCVICGATAEEVRPGTEREWGRILAGYRVAPSA